METEVGKGKEEDQDLNCVEEEESGPRKSCPPTKKPTYRGASDEEARP